MELERFNLHDAARWHSATRDPGFDTRYLPQHGNTFTLPCFWVARRHLYVYGRRTEYWDKNDPYIGNGPDDSVLFPVHPLSLPHYASFLSRVNARDVATEGLRIFAIATSSVRTILAWQENAPDKAFFVKTTMLPTAMLDDRRLFAHKIGSCVGVTRLLQSVPDLPGAFRYFPEAVGFVPRTQLDSGVIIRSIPPELMDGTTTVAPLFSLIGGTSAHPPLLPSMIERSGMAPLHYVEQVFCRQLCKLWLDLSLNHGLLPECHGQNLLIELSTEGDLPRRFYYRDMDGLSIDWELRRQLRLSMPRTMPYAWSWHEAYATIFPGAPYSELVSYKFGISLNAYLQLFLNELSQSLRSWHRQRMIGGPAIGADELTGIFARCLAESMQELFAFHCTINFDIHRQLKRLLLDLMRLRHGLLQARTLR